MTYLFKNSLIRSFFEGYKLFWKREREGGIKRKEDNGG